MRWNWQAWVQVTRAAGPLADRVVVLDAAGQVIADTGQAITGEQHPSEHLTNGAPVTLLQVDFAERITASLSPLPTCLTR